MTALPISPPPVVAVDVAPDELPIDEVVEEGV